MAADKRAGRIVERQRHVEILSLFKHDRLPNFIAARSSGSDVCPILAGTFDATMMFTRISLLF